MKHKGGYVYGSIYERKRKNGNTSYTAEIQFQGHIMRRSMKDKSVLEVWMQNVCEELNATVDEYNDALAMETMKIRNRLYDIMQSKAKIIMDNARQYDLRNKVCATAIGLAPSDTFQTYLITDSNNGLTKIGKSKDIHRRMQIIGTRHIQLIAYVGRDIESHLHKTYKHKRVKGEWFKLTEADQQEIIGLYGFITPGVLFISGGGVG